MVPEFSKGYFYGAQMLDRCPALKDYAYMTNLITALYRDGQELGKAIDLAIDECLKKGVAFSDLLRDMREEVHMSVITEFNQELYDQGLRAEGRAEGLAEGRISERNSIILRMHNLRVEEIMEYADETRDNVIKVLKDNGYTPVF